MIQAKNQVRLPNGIEILMNFIGTKIQIYEFVHFHGIIQAMINQNSIKIMGHKKKIKNSKKKKRVVNVKVKEYAYTPKILLKKPDGNPQKRFKTKIFVLLT